MKPSYTMLAMHVVHNINWHDNHLTVCAQFIAIKLNKYISGRWETMLVQCSAKRFNEESLIDAHELRHECWQNKIERNSIRGNASWIGNFILSNVSCKSTSPHKHREMYVRACVRKGDRSSDARIYQNYLDSDSCNRKRNLILYNMCLNGIC